jgi:hypothetical protein
MSLYFYYTSYNSKECSYYYLSSNLLNLVNRPASLILKSVHLDIRGIVHHWGNS